MLIKVQDERKQPFHIVDKLVTWFWIPFIGQTGYTLYNLYISLINYESKTAFPSIRRMADFMGVSENTIRKYNRLLCDYGLIRIEERINPENGGQLSHTYYILDAPPLPDHLQAEYRRRRLVNSKLMESRILQEAMEELETAVAAEPGEIPPLQSLKGGLQPLQEGVQPVKRGVQSLHQPPATSEGASLRKKEKNRKRNNNTASTSHTTDQEPAPGSSQVVVSEQVEELKRTLREFGVHARTAERLVRSHDPQKIAQACETLLYQIDQDRGPRDNAGWLVAAITQGYNLSTPQGSGGTKAKAKEQAQLEKHMEAETRKARAEFEQRREERLKELGVEPSLQAVWQRVIEELRKRGQWSPIFELAFLEELQGEAAVVRVEAEIARSLLEKPEREQALQQALRRTTGAQVYVTITGPQEEGAAVETEIPRRKG